MSKNILVIGAGGGIGHEVIRQLVAEDPSSCIFAVSRQQTLSVPSGVERLQLAEHTDAGIAELCAALSEKVSHFHRIICCTGVLHEGDLQPEKKLEQLDAASLQRYFAVNTIIPSLWLKHLPGLLDKKEASVITFLSARVGSISDNKLGGWYGYRASKAALNMLIKTAQVEYRRRRPQAILMSYHPGTVDTALSQPFQANVPQHKLFSRQQAAGYLLKQLEGLSPDKAPYYLDWQGNTIEW
ncbi:SDR family NAD(P)-dependent oxidoreductase [Lacimicrobium sp. SS2-24]|uniref:SDR family NAD(P)-dependent oxidoreductase n=1 Tax=Lacimicrobium sp. SS2-24 TaxID=2005569 RepID=UPI000B4BE851|nr:SDR family NAD(P)-dependent oxidoreductase [Lacimicrobium sp. SS2-24]